MVLVRRGPASHEVPGRAGGAEVLLVLAVPRHETRRDPHRSARAPGGLRPDLPARWDERLRDDLFPKAWAEASDRCDAAACRDAIRGLLATDELLDPLGAASGACCPIV